MAVLLALMLLKKKKKAIYSLRGNRESHECSVQAEDKQEEGLKGAHVVEHTDQ